MACIKCLGMAAHVIWFRHVSLVYFLKEATGQNTNRFDFALGLAKLEHGKGY